MVLLPTSVRLSSRYLSYYYLPKRCLGNSFHVKYHQINCSYKFLHPPIIFLKQNSINQFSSPNKTDDTEKISAQKIEAHVNQPVAKVNQRTRLKQAVRDYGATIIVFHVAISLTSLGLCYLAISNGVDAIRFLTFLGFSESIISSKVAVGGSTFVIAYAVHKLFAPVRIGITLSVAPFIVRYLRKINWIKPPKSKV